jgi:GGDEF domain-containing protein
VGRPFKDAVHPHTPALFRVFRDAFDSGETCEVERLILRGGRETWFRFVASPVGGDLLVTFIDVTDRKEREREMQVAASQDPLTGLLNRRGLEADAPALLSATEQGSSGCCLLYLDLDGLKHVNDSLGRGQRLRADRVCRSGPRLHAGPRHLRAWAGRVRAAAPRDRAGGAEDVASRVVRALASRSHRSAAPVCGVSIGIARQPQRLGLKDLLQATGDVRRQGARGGVEVGRAGRFEQARSSPARHAEAGAQGGVPLAMRSGRRTRASGRRRTPARGIQHSERSFRRSRRR